MKILHVVVSAGNGGIQTFFTRLGIALHARGVDQHMVMAPHPAREAAFRDRALPFTTIDFRRLFGIAGRLEMAATLRREKPDIVVAWDKRAAILLRRARCLTVGRLGNKERLDRYKGCDFLVGNSQPIVDHVLAHGRADVALISNFVAVECPPRTRPRGTAPRQLLAVGRLQPQKGIDVLVRALPAVDAELLIAGDGPDREVLEGLARDLGVADRVRFLGWRQDVAHLIADADAFVLPSRYEGTSNALLEAMAVGAAIVTTDGDGVSWFLSDGHDCRIARVGDPVTLAAALNDVLADPAEAIRLAENARRTYEQSFSEEIICGKWLNLFERLVAGARPR